MIGYKEIIEAQTYLVENWGQDGEKVIEACFHATPFNNTCKNFLKHCTPCGGNWGGLILSGIKELWPDVYNAIPDDMGLNVWPCLIYTILLCGVDTSSD